MSVHTDIHEIDIEDKASPVDHLATVLTGLRSGNIFDGVKSWGYFTGYAQGYTQKRAERLIEQLQRSFGNMPDRVVLQIYDARLETLDQLRDSAPRAYSLRELFGNSDDAPTDLTSSNIEFDITPQSLAMKELVNRGRRDVIVRALSLLVRTCFGGPPFLKSWDNFDECSLPALEMMLEAAVLATGMEGTFDPMELSRGDEVYDF